MEKEVETKVQKYVYTNYKDYDGKELFITELDNVFAIKKHINGGTLFLGKTIVD